MSGYVRAQLSGNAIVLLVKGLTYHVGHRTCAYLVFCSSTTGREPHYNFGTKKDWVYFYVVCTQHTLSELNPITIHALHMKNTKCTVQKKSLALKTEYCQRQSEPMLPRRQKRRGPG